MEKVLDIFVMVTTISVYLMNMDFRYSIKKIILLFVGFLIISCSVFTILLHQVFTKDVTSLISFFIPSLILCFWVSKYRDARFIFTFSLVNLITVIAVIFGKSISVPFNDNQTLVFISTATLLIIYLIGSLKFREKYLKILRSIKDGWRYLSVVTIMIYIFTFVLIGYPKPIYTRREYIPTVIVYLLLVAIIFKLIYESARSNIKIYIETIEKENLETKVEINEMYYELAYKDNLSGLQNRNSFEDYLEKLESDGDKKIACITFDIDNLKMLNDTTGHHIGDEVIKNFGYLLKKVFVSGEYMFRTGGDEFIVLADNYDERIISEKFKKMDFYIEKIRKDMNILFDYSRGKCIGNSTDIRNIIIIADKEMYKDKSMHKLLAN